MKLLKFSIFIVFLLSLLSAGLTFYLSNVRENEKEKRVYLEGIKTKNEALIKELESEIEGLKSKNQELNQKVREEQSAKDEVLNLIKDRDSALENFKRESEEARRAFEEAQRRNQELEKILDDLESRMQQMEQLGQATPTAETAIVGMEVVNNPDNINLEELPINQASSNAIEAAPHASSIELPTIEEPIAPTPVPETVIETPPASEEASIAAITEVPKPKKKRRLFGLLGPKAEKRSSQAVEETQAAETVSSAASTTTEPSTEFSFAPIQEEQPKTEVTEEATPQQQTIAAGGVLLINRVHNFAVINLGSRHGLSVGDMLSVQRSSSEIAKVRVEKLYEDYSAAYIVEEKIDNPIKEGDVVNAA